MALGLLLRWDALRAAVLLLAGVPGGHALWVACGRHTVGVIALRRIATLLWRIAALLLRVGPRLIAALLRRIVALLSGIAPRRHRVVVALLRRTCRRL